jgi:hypothetical protein
MTGFLRGFGGVSRSGVASASLVAITGFLTGIGGIPASWGDTILASFCSTEDGKAAVTTGRGWLSLDDEAAVGSRGLTASVSAGGSAPGGASGSGIKAPVGKSGTVPLRDALIEVAP